MTSRLFPPLWRSVCVRCLSPYWMLGCAAWLVILAYPGIALYPGLVTSLLKALPRPWMAGILWVAVSVLASLYLHLYILRWRKFFGAQGSATAACANCKYDCGAVAGREPGFVFRCPECGFRWSIDEYRYARTPWRERLRTPPPPPVSPRFEG